MNCHSAIGIGIRVAPMQCPHLTATVWNQDHNNTACRKVCAGIQDCMLHEVTLQGLIPCREYAYHDRASGFFLFTILKYRTALARSIWHANCQLLISSGAATAPPTHRASVMKLQSPMQAGPECHGPPCRQSMLGCSETGEGSGLIAYSHMGMNKGRNCQPSLLGMLIVCPAGIRQSSPGLICGRLCSGCGED